MENSNNIFIIVSTIFILVTIMLSCIDMCSLEPPIKRHCMHTQDNCLSHMLILFDLYIKDTSILRFIIRFTHVHTVYNILNKQVCFAFRELTSHCTGIKRLRPQYLLLLMVQDLLVCMKRSILLILVILYI